MIFRNVTPRRIRSNPLNRPKRLVALILILILSCFEVIIWTLNFHGMILWYPHVDILRIIKNKCYYNHSSNTHFTKSSKVSDSVVDLKNIPMYILHGRLGDVSSKILEPLRKQLWNYTISNAARSADQQQQYSSNTVPTWECQVVKAHANILQQAFTSHPSSPFVLILEDDAYLSQPNNLLHAIQYFNYHKLPFYSLYHTTTKTSILSCTDYKYSMVAYVIRYNFYKQIVSTCLARCDRPLDICLSKMYALEQVPVEVFLHGSLASTRPKVRNLITSAFVVSNSLRASQVLRQGSTSTSFEMSDGEESCTYPELAVYDMDACLWDQEMYTMSAMPSKTVLGDLNGRGEGVVGVMSGNDKIALHKGSLISLQEHYDGRYSAMKVAMASSAVTPFAEKVGRASLKMLEVVPGVTVWDILMRDWNGEDVNQIGRQPPLSSNKSLTHFPFLREKTGIRYDRMLFFDDCNWGDHCLMVEQNCKEEDNGKCPVTVRTPRGLGEKEWRQGLEMYAERNANCS